MSIEEYIRNRINDLLKSTDVPVTKISHLIGYNSAYLTQILKGTNKPSFDGLKAICEYFQITVSDFFDPEFHGNVSDKYLLTKLSMEDKKFLLEILKDEKKLKAIENLIESFNKTDE